MSIPVMLTRRSDVGVQTRSEFAEVLDGGTKIDNAKRTESMSSWSTQETWLTDDF